MPPLGTQRNEDLCLQLCLLKNVHSGMFKTAHMETTHVLNRWMGE